MADTYPTLNLSFEKSLETQAWVRGRLKELQRIDEPTESQACELTILERIAEFPFEAYPDYCVPWHLLRWPTMRWEHIADVIDIIELLRQPTGAHIGEPLVLEPFQVMILTCFLGPEDPDTGLRVVKEGLLTLARKNAKTTTIAALIVALMSLDPEFHGLRGAEIQVGAADRSQAGILHQMCERMIYFDQQLGLDEKYHSTPSYKKLKHKKTLTELTCLSSDAYRAHGANPAIVILDEIGNVPHHQAEEFYSVLTSAFGAQTEPLTLLLSTQAPNDQHFFSQMVDLAKRINEGMVEGRDTAGFVFTLPETDEEGAELDTHDEGLWYLANPGLDTILSRQDLKRWAKKALDMPSLQNKFENLKLNRRVSETASLISRLAWERNGFTFDPATLLGRRCWAGVDLAETTDLAALVLVFEEIEELGGLMPVWPFFWIPGENLQERCRSDKVPYDVWTKEGLVDATSSQTIDYGLIADRIVQCIEDYELEAIGFDRWKMKYLRAKLEERGYSWTKEERFLIEIGQGFKDQPRSIDLLEQAILNGKLAHGNHPVLKWNAGNTVTVSDPAKNRKFEKSKSFGRIDGIVGLSAALHARDAREVEEDVMNSILNDPNREVVM